VRGTQQTQQTFLWFHRFDRANAQMQEEAISCPGVPHRVAVRDLKTSLLRQIGAQFCMGAKVGQP